MPPSEKEAPLAIRVRDAWMKANLQRTNAKKETMTPAKKETQTPSTKLYNPIPPRLSMNVTPRSKRDLVVVSDDDEHQPPRKRQVFDTPASQESSTQQEDTAASETVSREEFLQLRTMVSKLLVESREDKCAIEDMKGQIATLEEAVVLLGGHLDRHEGTIDKIQIRALEALLKAEQLQTQFNRSGQEQGGW